MKQIAFRSFFLFSFLVFFSLILGMETAFSTPSLYSAIRRVDDPGQSPALPEPSTQKRAAIVIDDFGNKMGGTEDMLALPFPITVAVMPFLQTTKADAEAAHAAGKEVIIHLPMEPKIARKSWLGPGVISTDLKMTRSVNGFMPLSTRFPMLSESTIIWGPRRPGMKE
ncbi:divergent polysaccharide deacetylase family protein [Paenibacillus larvae]